MRAGARRVPPPAVRASGSGSAYASAWKTTSSEQASYDVTVRFTGSEGVGGPGGRISVVRAAKTVTAVATQPEGSTERKPASATRS